MELPAEVLVHNELLGIKGSRGTLLRVGTEGYFEINLQFGENLHRVLLPVHTTVLIASQPEAEFPSDFEVER